MKTLLLTAISILISASTFAQKFIAKSECPTFNKFLKSESLENLESISADIYPGGQIVLRGDRDEQYEDLEDMTSLLGLSSDYSFEEVSVNMSRYDKNIEYRRFQEYYKGVPVDGGGVTMAYIIPHGPGHDPCQKQAHMLSPYIYTDIDMPVSANISEDEFSDIIGTTNITSAELVIEQFNCNYQLAWKVNYMDEKPLVSWIDANTGANLKTAESTMYKNAPTLDYDVQNMDDSELNNMTRLVSSDGSIITYDFDSESILPVESDYTDNLIPTSAIGSDWTTSDAESSVYQAHWVTTLTKQYYQTLDIDFGTLHVAANFLSNNAFALGGSTMSEAFIGFGNVFNNSNAHFDIAGHELAHIILLEFLDFEDSSARSLHEGIADMFGVYIEMLHNQGDVDWTIGEDQGTITRDLENPDDDCFEDVKDLTIFFAHSRAEPLGHWFYLVSTEGGIPLDRTLNIVLESLNHISDDADYPELMDATLLAARLMFGRCSDEYTAINNAWEAICVPTPLGVIDETCTNIISGPTVICEEDDQANFCVQPSWPNSTGNRWRIIGKKSTDFESACGMSGNSQYGCSCLYLTDFPKYPYYPQYLTIEVYNSSVEGDNKIRKSIKLVDCNGDDPTCEEYYDLSIGNPGSEVEIFDSSNKSFAEKEEIQDGIKNIRIFDALGNLVLTGSQLQIQNDYNNLPSGIYFVSKFDENGQLVSTEKTVLIQN